MALLAILPQVKQRVDFSLEWGTILVAGGSLLLISVLLVGALYPFFTGNSLFGDEESSDEETSGPDREEIIKEGPSDDDKPPEKKVDDFLGEMTEKE